MLLETDLFILLLDLSLIHFLPVFQYLVKLLADCFLADIFLIETTAAQILKQALVVYPPDDRIVVVVVRLALRSVRHLS